MPSLSTQKPAPRVKLRQGNRSENTRRSQVELTVSWSALAKILVVAGLVALGIVLARLAELVFLSLLLGLALSRVVQYFSKRNLPRWLGISAAVALVLVLIGFFVGLLAPAIANQGSALIAHLPDVQKELVNQLPATGPLRDAVNKLLQSASFSDPEQLMKGFVACGLVVVKGVSELLIVLVIAIYLLIDGERIYRWLVAFLPPRHRAKVRVAAPKIATIVSGFVAGQFVTSCLCGVYAFVVLYLFHVPNAALLAATAALFDILPVIGFFAFAIPAIGLAYTVSPLSAAAVGGLYGAYHLLETYLIVPKVYGDQLKLSTLTVLLACMAGWLLAGVIGAIAILPLVAAYPVVEQLWLKPHLEPDTVPKHKEIEKEHHPES